ncbi:MAG TPA: hypothetical protein VD930_09060 [Gemmatimonadales bacterium]|nr:hypothetical protein [Gemmatimonadales bacterium]
MTLTAVLLIGGSCTTKDTDRAPPPANITQVLERHTDSLMRIPGVVGTAEGLCAGRPCVLVFVKQNTPEVRKAIPERIDGFEVELRESGPIQAR